MLTVSDRAPAGTPAGPRVARMRIAGRPPAGDWPATCALAALTVAAALGFVRVFSGHTWLGPVVAGALGVHTVCWLSRRWRLPLPVGLILGAAGVWLLAVWTVLGQYTAYGIPVGRTMTAFHQAVQEARADFPSSIAPVFATPGFLLLAVLGTGLVAFLADCLAFRWRSALAGALPSLLLFVVCSTTSQGPGRPWVVFLEMVGVLVFVSVHRLSGGTVPRVWLGGDSSGLAGWAARAAGMTGGLAILSALLVVPALATYDGTGVFGWRSGTGPGSSAPRIVTNPIVQLQTRLIQETSTPVFLVTSSVPSYWRLTSLDSYTGDTWSSTASYRGFGSRLPGSAAVPAATRTVTERFTIQDLESPWLPDAFNPLSVQGVRGVSYDPVSGSLITSRATSDGLTYTVTSYQYLSTLSPAQLEAAASLHDLGAQERYLQLPAIPPPVTALAKRLTAGKPSEYEKALAIQDYLLSPPFTYSLTPVSDGTSNLALYNFLFETHSGYCQQFAGAYAVLARAAGLPTRLAVGFTTGTPDGPSTYLVTDADAHTWPEVYFGRSYGWLPFEPTPSFDNPNASSYAGTGRPGALGGSSTSPDTVPTVTKPGQGPRSAPKGTPRTVPTTVAVPASAARGHHRSSALAYVLIVALAVLGWAVLNATSRRLRWRARRWAAARRGPAGVVLAHWADVTEMLSWLGATARHTETDDEFARRASAQLASVVGEPSPWLSRGIARLAALAREAAFAPPPARSSDREAALVAIEIRQRLFRTARLRQLLTWMFLPRPGWGRSRPDAFGT